MPRGVRAGLEQFADEWDQRGVRAWHEGWWELGKTTGNLLAPILGVPEDTITMHQNVSVVQSLVTSCFDFSGRRNKIVLQDLDFPTNHYVFEGARRAGAEIVYVPSGDSIRAPIDRLVDLKRTASALFITLETLPADDRALLQSVALGGSEMPMSDRDRQRLRRLRVELVDRLRTRLGPAALDCIRRF